MFFYYGSKANMVKYYPPPEYGRIIEPFAGSAQYSLKYFDREVLLVDKYEVIIKIWKWLQKCSPGDIRGLPRLKFGENVDSFNWDCIEAKWLVGMVIQWGINAPRKSASKSSTISRPNTQNYKYNFIADNLHKIRHWEIRLGSYEDIPNEPATWFIDPPYQYGGEYYRESNKAIDYSELASWSRSRLGQVIVCENTRADWLDFRPLKRISGVTNKWTVEAIWTNRPFYYQSSLF